MKAFVLSIVSSLFFLMLVGWLFNSEKRHTTRPYTYPPTVLNDCPKVDPPAPVAPADPNDKFRYVDVGLPLVDFRNRSFGEYRFTDGKTTDLKLMNGEFEYDNGSEGSRGWFFLKDIFYTDVTGDGKAEALIWLIHVECGVSCDGGRGLFYIYTTRNDAWQEIWKYETGSYGYGCGLKSLTVLNKQLVLQMFGSCSQPEKESDNAQKYFAIGTTITQFRFNGSRFIKRESEFVSAPAREVKNFSGEIHIVE